MEIKKNFSVKVEYDATDNTKRVLRTINLAPDSTLFAHFSFLRGAFFAAMKRAKLEGFDQTFASGLYYTGDASALREEDRDTNEWIWMPVETEKDRRFLFSPKPWEKSGFDPAVQKEIAKKLKTEFETFQKEMLS